MVWASTFHFPFTNIIYPLNFGYASSNEVFICLYWVLCFYFVPLLVPIYFYICCASAISFNVTWIFHCFHNLSLFICSRMSSNWNHRTYTQPTRSKMIKIDIDEQWFRMQYVLNRSKMCIARTGGVSRYWM